MRVFKVTNDPRSEHWEQSIIVYLAPAPTSDINPGLWLVEREHMTQILASDWSIGRTWHRFWPLIGREVLGDTDTGYRPLISRGGSRDTGTGLLLVEEDHVKQIPAYRGPKWPAFCLSRPEYDGEFIPPTQQTFTRNLIAASAWREWDYLFLFTWYWDSGCATHTPLWTPARTSWTSDSRARRRGRTEIQNVSSHAHLFIMQSGMRCTSALSHVLRPALR